MFIEKLKNLFEMWIEKYLSLFPQYRILKYEWEKQNATIDKITARKNTLELNNEILSNELEKYKNKEKLNEVNNKKNKNKKF